jgi:penicillin-binding protein 1B
MARKTKSPRGRRSFGRLLLLGSLITVLASLPVLAVYVFYLDWRVTSQFEGKRWALPARVYARPLELYEGLELRPENLETELRAANYRQEGAGREPGSYTRIAGGFRLTTRAFQFPDGAEPAHAIEIGFSGNRVSRLRSQSGKPLDLVRLDAALIGSIYPAQQEDRVLVRLEDVPPLLIDALLTLEDRDFHQHHGISFTGVARALVANLQAGRVVQGGSTITQQLVKNFYLSRDRTLVRKANEALMALLLEYHYSKDEILEAYLNEVYLGQDGRRGVHGFGLAAQHYFGRPLGELKPHQLATLAAMVKGPSYYDPRRHPKRILERRNLTLDLLAQSGVLPTQSAREAKRRSLEVSATGRSGDTQYPAFMELVKEHLRRDYRADDLSSEGLRIFTTLAPHVQEAAEMALVSRLRQWPDRELEGAVVVLNVDDASVLSLVGGRDPRFAGYNRALYARRPIGSLIKPAVYLAALERPQEFGLGTLLQDKPVSLKSSKGEIWSPKNYDGELHGEVPLWEALSYSYNLPAVRLGMQVGMRPVLGVMDRLGLQSPSHAYPSLFLGAVNYTPVEVAQMYHTLASGGFRSEPRAVRAVMTRDDVVLSRYPLVVERAFEPGPVYLLDYALQAVMWGGTGRGAAQWLGPQPGVAGKTGTTDDLRDSWFAGFSADTLAVTWIGRDDNGKTGLTGSSGALTVWAQLFAKLDWRPLELMPPDSVEPQWIERDTGRLSAGHCSGAVALPYLRGYLPEASSHCVDERDVFQKASDWLKEIL